MYEMREEPWSVSDERFPREAVRSEQLKYLLNYAVLAPSVYNTQPWLFKVTGAEVAMYVDRARAMPVTDPLGRNLVISCGAALFHLRIAIRHFGYVPVVRTFPDLDVANLLAFVRFGERRKAAPEECRLFEAISSRRTIRSGFRRKVVPADLLHVLQRAAAKEGAHLTIVCEPSEQRFLIDAIREASEFRHLDGPSRLEIEKWTRASPAERTNGGVQRPAMPTGGTRPRRSGRRGLDQEKFGAGDKESETGEPPFVVLATTGDNMASWLSAGQALGRVLLTAAAHGLSASFLSQALGIDHLRASVRSLIGDELQPQLILRIGYGAPGPERRTSRLPVDVVASDE